MQLVAMHGMHADVDWAKQATALEQVWETGGLHTMSGEMIYRGPGAEEAEAAYAADVWDGEKDEEAELARADTQGRSCAEARRERAKKRELQQQGDGGVEVEDGGNTKKQRAEARNDAPRTEEQPEPRRDPHSSNS